MFEVKMLSRTRKQIGKIKQAPPQMNRQEINNLPRLE